MAVSISFHMRSYFFVLCFLFSPICHFVAVEFYTVLVLPGRCAFVCFFGFNVLHVSCCSNIFSSLSHVYQLC